jgi:ADP-ribose pyrophosphatase YjhB (NUDIX family)
MPGAPARVGVVVIRRTVEPRAGWLALPGGFIEVGETWQEACAREACEEAALRIDPAAIAVRRVASTPNNLAVFGEGALLEAADLPPFTPNAEASERLLLFAFTELAFPLHSDLLAETLATYTNDSIHAAA